MVFNGFELKCIEIDKTSEYNDPRAITTFGFDAPTLSIKPAEVVASIQFKKQQNDQAYVHLKVAGEEVIPKAVETDIGKALRTKSEWTSEDPLMELPRRDEYELDTKMSSI